MKTLTLLRHAKSDIGDRGVRDFDRTINAKGERAAATMGRQARALGLTFDQVVASPAVRVEATLDKFARGHGDVPAAEWDKRIYLASAVTLLDVVHGAADAHDRLLLVGHNPGIEDLVLLLAPDDASTDRAAVFEKFPTASLAVLEFDVANWADLAAGEGHLARFVRPRDIDPALGPDD